MSDPNEPAPTNAPLSWRDVYKAVGDSEARVIEAIRAAVAPMSDHEVRIRAIEQNGSPEAIEALARVATLEKSVVPLAISTAERDKRLAVVEAQSIANKDAIDRFIYREAGIFSTLGAGKTVILVALAAAGPILAIIGIVSK